MFLLQLNIEATSLTKQELVLKIHNLHVRLFQKLNKMYQVLIKNWPISSFCPTQIVQKSNKQIWVFREPLFISEGAGCSKFSLTCAQSNGCHFYCPLRLETQFSDFLNSNKSTKDLFAIWKRKALANATGLPDMLTRMNVLLLTKLSVCFLTIILDGEPITRLVDQQDVLADNNTNFLSGEFDWMIRGAKSYLKNQ